MHKCLLEDTYVLRSVYVTNKYGPLHCCTLHQHIYSDNRLEQSIALYEIIYESLVQPYNDKTTQIPQKGLKVKPSAVAFLPF